MAHNKHCPTCHTTHDETWLFCSRDHVLESSSPEDPLCGRTLGERYKLASVLGRGGFGTVYLAAQLHLQNRPCVVKTARPELSTDPEFVARFRRERNALAELVSPNTVFILDHGTSQDGVEYLVMEYVDGPTLRHLLKQNGRLAPARAIRIASGICRSLEEAHSRGILHRDLKPANVMILDPGQSEWVKVIDFGLARFVAHSESSFQTRTGAMPGTPVYASPEQLAGQTHKVGTASDIYSLGATLYEMVTGIPPFGDTVTPPLFDHAGIYFMALYRAKMETLPTSPKSLAPPVLLPERFERLLVSLLAPKPEERPASIAAVREELAACLRQLEPSDAITGDSVRGDMAPAAWADTLGAPSATQGYQGSLSQTESYDEWAGRTDTFKTGPTHASASAAGTSVAGDAAGMGDAGVQPAAHRLGTGAAHRLGTGAGWKLPAIAVAAALMATVLLVWQFGGKVAPEPATDSPPSSAQVTSPVALPLPQDRKVDAPQPDQAKGTPLVAQGIEHVPVVYPDGGKPPATLARPDTNATTTNPGKLWASQAAEVVDNVPHGTRQAWESASGYWTRVTRSEAVSAPQEPSTHNQGNHRPPANTARPAPLAKGGPQSAAPAQPGSSSSAAGDQATFSVAMKRVEAQDPHCNEAQAAALVRSLKGPITTCYKKRLKVLATLGGTLRLRWACNLIGEVLGIAVVNDTVEDDVLTECISNVIKAASFPGPDPDEPRYCSYTWVFEFKP